MNKRQEKKEQKKEQAKKTIIIEREKKNLFRFLKEKYIFIKFLKNCSKSETFKWRYGNDINKMFDWCFCRKSPISPIDWSFEWSKTQEGFFFWHALNEQWYNANKN